MNKNVLESSYRNLLISLARDAEELKTKVAELHLEVKEEQRVNRRDAIRSLIAERNKRRSRLLFLLSKNAGPLRYFFGTVNPLEISCEQFSIATNHE